MGSDLRKRKKIFNIQFPIYILPISVWVILFVLAPLIIILVFSVLQTGDFGRIVYKFTLKNYKLLIQAGYMQILIRSLLLSLLTSTLCTLIGYPLAYYISKYGGKWKTLLLLLIIIPSWTAYLIRLYAFKTITSRTGLLNNLLLQLHIISSPLELLYTPLTVVLGLVYTWIPFMILPLFASMDGLDPSLLEAAYDLGANPFSRFFKITVPLTRGGLIAGTILVFIPSLGDWLVPALLGGAKVMMIGNLIAHKFIQVGDIPRGACLAIFLSAIVVLVLYLSIKWGGEEALEKLV